MKDRPRPPGFTPVETTILSDEWSTIMRCVCGAEMSADQIAEHDKTCTVLHMQRVLHAKNNRKHLNAEKPKS